MAQSGRKTALALIIGLMLVLAITVVILEKSFAPTPFPSASQPIVNELAAADTATDIVGVGVAIGLDKNTGGLIVLSVLPNSPAAEAGLKSHVIVNRVDGVPTAGKKLKECMDLIRGPAGTKVKLELITPATHETNVVELTRRKIDLHR